MSIDATTIHQAKASGFGQVPAWLWLGAGLYVLLLVNSSGLLNDSTLLAIAVGQSILDHGALPRVDVYSFTKPGEAWISSSWLANPLCHELQSGWLDRAGRAHGRRDRCDLWAARAYFGAPPSLDLCGPGGAGGHGAVDAAFSGASARAGDAGHGCLGVRFDDRERAPSAAVILVAAADCALGQPPRRLRVRSGAGRRIRDRRSVEHRAVAAKPLALRWFAFGLAALAACCVTPYGWESILASRKILDLGELLRLISESAPADSASSVRSS